MSKMLGKDARDEILECLGISRKNVRNVRIVIQAHKDSAAVATIEIDRFVEDDEIAMLTTIADECSPTVIERLVKDD